MVAELVQYYRKSDSNLVMYDLVTNTFYTNVDSGKFIVDPTVN